VLEPRPAQQEKEPLVNHDYIGGGNGTPQTFPFSLVPEELKARPQWVCWRYIDRHGKPTKMPLEAKTGKAAKATDPATWTDFATALHAYQTGVVPVEGIGFVLSSNDPYVGVDLDDCVNSTKAIEPWASAIIDELSTYTEFSPSGRGVKIWAHAAPLPPGGRRRKGQIEMYSENRFFTVTGRHLDGTPQTIEERTDPISQLYARIFAEDSRPSAALHHEAHVGPNSDQAILKRVTSDPRYAALFHGDVSRYDSPSEADLALAGRIGFFVNWDGAAIERIFGLSELANREKWKREDYRKRTIDAVCRGKVGCYSKGVRDNDNDRPRPQPTARSSAPVPLLSRVSEIERRPVRWLWHNRIARGKLNLIYGDPGLGKSHLTLDIAARVTRGFPWPDDPSSKAEPADVILLSAEDDIADTIAPRLDGAEADCTRVHVLNGVSWKDASGTERERSITLADLPLLEQTLQARPDTALVIIDPVSAYVAEIDSHKNADVRGLLAPLAKLATHHNVAIVMVTHMSKMTGSKALYRATGSLAFIAACRTAWLVVEDGDDPTRRLFLMAKSNLAPLAGGLAFRISNGRLMWEGDPVSLRADEALGAVEMPTTARPRMHRPDAPKLDATAEWLKRRLADGPVASKEIQQDAKEALISVATLRRARHRLGIVPYRLTIPGPWLCHLPNAGSQDAHVSTPLSEI
jgi:hypothetical protein